MAVNYLPKINIVTAPSVCVCACVCGVAKGVYCGCGTCCARRVAQLFRRSSIDFVGLAFAIYLGIFDLQILFPQLDKCVCAATPVLA